MVIRNVTVCLADKGLSGRAPKTVRFGDAGVKVQPILLTMRTAKGIEIEAALTNDGTRLSISPASSSHYMHTATGGSHTPCMWAV